MDPMIRATSLKFSPGRGLDNLNGIGVGDLVGFGDLVGLFVGILVGLLIWGLVRVGKVSGRRTGVIVGEIATKVGDG